MAEPDADLETILIVGGGCFGLSTALSLVRGPYCRCPGLITVIDRSATPPATDAASSDYNKIVRQDYSDPTYARLAHAAIRQWSTPEYSPYYFNSGCLVLANSSHSRSTYVSKALEVNSDPSLRSGDRQARSLPSSSAISGIFDPRIPTAGFTGDIGYLNENGGWANARGAMENVCALVREAGVAFEVGDVVELVGGEKREKKNVLGHRGRKADVLGVRTREGRVLRADKVVLAAGSWSCKLVPELGKELLATGHSVGHIQLTEDEAELYRRIPVVFHMDTGFYLFPPNAKGILKFAIHGPGYLNPSHGLPSTPRTHLSSGNTDLPPEAIEELRAGLKRVFPELAKKEWLETRMCWYCDSPSSDWLLDYHPEYPSLFLATGDSGHAFKFLPTIGGFITSAIFRTLPPELEEMWSFSRITLNKGDPSRGGDECFARKTLEPEPRVVADRTLMTGEAKGFEAGVLRAKL